MLPEAALQPGPTWATKRPRKALQAGAAKSRFVSPACSAFLACFAKVRQSAHGARYMQAFLILTRWGLTLELSRQ